MRAVPTLLAVSLALLLGPVTGSGLAQTSEPVHLVLASQTPWTTPQRPVLRIAVLATNPGASPLGRLSMEVAFGESIVSRFGYETSLTDGPGSIAARVDVPVEGRLEPGLPRAIAARVDMSTLAAIVQDDSRVYPLQVTVRSGGRVVASLNSAAIYLVRRPEAPLLFSWWATFQGDPAFDTGDRLTQPAIEAALGSDGSLGAPAQALAALEQNGAIPIDVIVQPSLLRDAQQMARGYTRSDGTRVAAGTGGAAAADAFLKALTTAAAAPPVQLVGLPYSGASLPALLGSGLQDDADRQQQRGDQILASILGVDPVPGVSRPPSGLLDDATLAWLVGRGQPTVLADASTVDRPPGASGLAPPPTATIFTPSGQATLVLPDPGTDALLQRTDLLADPVRAAQAVLGELAVVWKEAPAPSPPTQRGVAVALPSILPAQLWGPLLARLGHAPFLRAGSADILAAGVSPPGAQTTLPRPETSRFSFGYARQIRSLRRDVGAYASMLGTGSSEPDRLRDDLLQAEASSFVLDEAAGQPWLDEVARVTQEAFASSTPQVQQLFTFTSREGTIPLRMGDPGSTPLTVTVQLEAAQFDFPDGAQQRVVLSRPNQIVTFRVIARAAGRNPLKVVVFSPSGRAISDQTIVVRTTAVNGIALVVTAAAALGLLLLYGRRWVRRRTR